MDATTSSVVVPLKPSSTQTPIELSSSKVEAYLSCPRQYFLKYVLKARQTVEPLTLVYGTLVHAALEEGLRALIAGQPADFGEILERLWAERLAQGGFSYKDGGRSVTPKDVLTYGRNAMKAFTTWWQKGEYEVLIDPTGEPVIEQSVTVDLGDGIIFSMKIDLVATHLATMEAHVFDFKTPGAAKPAELAEFDRFAPQLTGYEVGARMARHQFGIDRIGGSAFINLQKLKTEARIEVPAELSPRTPAQINGWIRGVQRVASNIRQGCFEPTPRMAHSSPCGMCDFRRLCWERDDEGLVFKSKGDRDTALATALAA